MMLPMPLIPVEHILMEAESASKRTLIDEMAALLPSVDGDQVLEVVMAREALGSTGIGHGVAIPHGRVPDLTEPLLALARHPKGLDFDAIDGQPVRIVILLLVPEHADRTHLELLAYLARILQNEQTREAIMHADSAEEISGLLSTFSNP